MAVVWVPAFDIELVHARNKNILIFRDQYAHLVLNWSFMIVKVECIWKLLEKSRIRLGVKRNGTLCSWALFWLKESFDYKIPSDQN